MKHVRLPDWEGGELPVWPPHRRPSPMAITPVLGGDPRLSTDRWWEVREEQAQAAVERAAREEKALENYHGPRWWERARV
jgi:hypothetical protein